MKLRKPFEVSDRLMVGLRCGGGWIHIGYSKVKPDSKRIRYEYLLDLPDGSSHSGTDLQSGKNVKHGLQSAFGDLLAFLGAAAADYRHRNRQFTDDPEDNCNLFDKNVVKWSHKNEAEINDLREEIESGKELIKE